MGESVLVSLVLPLANVVIMLAVGLVLSASDLRCAASTPRPLLAGLIGQYVAVPLLAFGIAHAFALPPAIAIGFILVAASPSASASNLLSYYAGGNVGLAVTLTAVSAVGSLISIPVLVDIASRWWGGSALQIHLPLTETLMRLMLLVVLPLSVGMCVRHINPAFAARAERWASRAGLLALVSVIVLYVVLNWSLIGSALGSLWAPTMLQAVLAMGAGYVVAAFSGVGRRDSITIALEVGVHNCMLALLVATTLIKSTDVAVPALTYGVLMFVPALAVVLIARRSRHGMPSSALR